MKILMINDSLILGGRERRFVEVIKGLTNLGYEIEVVILRNVVDYPIIYQYASKVHILERKIKKDPRVFFQLYKIYREFKPDIIHSWSSQGSIYALPVLAFNRVKLLNAMIADSTCKKYSFSWAKARITYMYSDIILSNSYAGLKAYGASGKKNAFVIHNGYDFNRSANHTDTAEIKKQFDIQTPKVVGMIAAFHIRRDYRTYLEAANILCKKYDDVTFLCIGDGPTEEEHKLLVAKEFLNTRIKFLGFQKNVESIINMMDISVLLVNADLIQEGLSNAIVESMAHGKPVIATNSGGSLEIVINNETGFFVEPYAADELVTKLEILLTDEGLRNTMGEKACEQIRQNFSFEHMIDSTIELYQKMKKH